MVVGHSSPRKNDSRIHAQLSGICHQWEQVLRKVADTEDQLRPEKGSTIVINVKNHMASMHFLCF